MQARRSRRAPLAGGATKCCRSKPWCVYRCSMGEADVGLEADVVHVKLKVKKKMSQKCKDNNGLLMDAARHRHTRASSNEFGEVA